MVCRIWVESIHRRGSKIREVTEAHEGIKQPRQQGHGDYTEVMVHTEGEGGIKSASRRGS